MRRIEISTPVLSVSAEISREPPHTTYRRAVERFCESNVFYRGPYVDWNAASIEAGGYAAANILDKAIEATAKVVRGDAAYERDTVTFQERTYVHPLMSWLLYVASRSGGALRVLDFGGALGSSYFQHRPILGHLPELIWCVVEQPHFVEAGNAKFADGNLHFRKSIDEAVTVARPNFLLMSGVLQYLEDPGARLAEILSLGIPYVLLDRVTAQYDQPGRVYVQHVPSWIYEASYPVWFLDGHMIDAQMEASGYRPLERFKGSAEFGTRLPLSVEALAPRQVLRGSDSEGYGPWPHRGWFMEKTGDS